jgi:hypothetical protein
MISIGRTLWFLLLVILVWSGLTAWQISEYTAATHLPGTCESPIECKFTSPIAELELSTSETVFKQRIDQNESDRNRVHNIILAADNTWMDFLYIPPVLERLRVLCS